MNLDEAEFKVGVPRVVGPGRRRLLYRVRPVLVLHATLAYILGTAIDFIISPCVLFGTTVCDFTSSILACSPEIRSASEWRPQGHLHITVRIYEII